MPPALRAVVYWLAVLAVSLMVVLALVLLLESRDEGGLETGMTGAAVTG